MKTERIREERCLLSPARIASIRHWLSIAKDVGGDTAEIGMAAGGTSRIIATSNGGRRHWASDTCVGLQDVGPHDPTLKNGNFGQDTTTLKSVTEYLADIPNIEIVVGYFPLSAPIEMIKRKFCFVHIDTDTYRSTLGAFNFFRSKMSKGGMVLMDDALSTSTPGVIKAWRELQLSNQLTWQAIGSIEHQVIVRFC